MSAEDNVLCLPKKERQEIAKRNLKTGNKMYCDVKRQNFAGKVIITANEIRPTGCKKCGFWKVSQIWQRKHKMADWPSTNLVRQKQPKLKNNNSNIKIFRSDADKLIFQAAIS